jgi:hypothetical protein
MRFVFNRLSAPIDGIVSCVPIRTPIVPGAVAFSILHCVHGTPSLCYQNTKNWCDVEDAIEQPQGTVSEK